MNAERQLALFKEARDYLNQGYALMREALAVGPVRLNRDESIDLWRATSQLIDDMVPALEAFITNDLADMMEEKSLTRKQIWRLYFLKKEGITAADLQAQREEDELEREERAAQWRQERANRAREEHIRKEVAREYYRRVTSIYTAFGLYVPRPCEGFTQSGSKCNGSASRHAELPLCTQHQPTKAYKVRQAEWELYFNMTASMFDAEVKRCIVPFNAAWPILWDIVEEAQA